MGLDGKQAMLSKFEDGIITLPHSSSFLFRRKTLPIKENQIRATSSLTFEGIAMIIFNIQIMKPPERRSDSFSAVIVPSALESASEQKAKRDPTGQIKTF